jgi:hypothetical protein
MQLHPTTFSQGTGFNLNCSWYLTAIMFQHVRPSARRRHTQTPRSNCLPNSTHCSQSGQHQEENAELQECTVVISTMYSHVPCPVNTWLWRQIQSLKCWIQMAWSCSWSHKTSWCVVFRQASNHNFILYGTEVCLMALNCVCSLYQLNKMKPYEDWSCLFWHQKLWNLVLLFYTKFLQEVKFLFISVQLKPHVVLKSYFFP